MRHLNRFFRWLAWVFKIGWELTSDEPGYHARILTYSHRKTRRTRKRIVYD